MQTEELKLLRLNNQFLLVRAEAKPVVSGLIGLQAQYGAQALHALSIRSSGKPDLSEFVKAWTLRGTLHLHQKSDLPIVLYQGSQTAFGQMAFYSEHVEKARAEHFRRLILNALAERDLTRDQLKALCSADGLTAAEEEILFHPWGGIFRAMAENGEIAYTSDGNRVFTRLLPFTPLEKPDALQELMRRYIRHYGPVSLRDAQTFFGIPQRELKSLLELTAEETVSIGKDTYYFMPRGLPEGADMPEVIFLAGFDQLLLGYRKTENPFLPPEQIKRVYNNTGIVFPTVLLQGRVSAVWKRAGKVLEIKPFGKINAKDKKQIERKAVDNFGGVGVKWIYG